MSRESPALAEALRRFESLSPREIDLSLDRVRAVLDRLGRPQDALAPVIHVAGTNGKGSTCAFLRAIGEAAGLRVHVYTSPHLVRFNERIRLDGQLVEDSALVGWLDRVLSASQGLQITHFEATTAAAFLAFAETPGDLIVLEVGLGGRFDATNVVDRPAACVIAPVDYDHREYLSGELTRIAWAKAGIARPGVPLVSAPQRPEALGVIALEAHERGAPLRRLGAAAAFDSDAGTGRMRYRGRQWQTGWVRPGLIGAHQHANAALACLAMEAWGDRRITPAALETGIAQARWPARMQRLAGGPLTALAPGAEVWLDGGHNPHAARAIADMLADMTRADARPLVLITAMMANKDHDGFFAALAASGASVVATANAAGHKGADPETLAGSARLQGLKAYVEPELDAAIARAVSLAGGQAFRLLICGSLYLAGEVLARNGEIPD